MEQDERAAKIFFLRPEQPPGAELMGVYDSRHLWYAYHETYSFCACRTANFRYRYRGGTHQAASFKVLFLQPRLFADIDHELGIAGAPHFGRALTRDPRIYGALYQLSAAIAAQLGFADQSHFIRHFKRVMNATPGQYARNAL